MAAAGDGGVAPVGRALGQCVRPASLLCPAERSGFLAVANAQDEVREQIASLVQEGGRIMLLETARRVLADDPDMKPTESVKKELKDFNLSQRYQGWYSKALPVVGQLLPDRLEEFVEAYKPARPPKTIDIVTYGITHYISGITVTRFGGEEVFNASNVFNTRMELQVQIVRSAQDRIDSIMSDIRGTLEAELFDDELAGADELRKKKHLRAAGVVAGVVLERHLKRVCANHRITIRKKNPGIADLNDALKDKVYDTPRWREIQLYADIRNYAGHDKERDPTADEIAELIRGTERIVKLVF